MATFFNGALTLNKVMLSGISVAVLIDKLPTSALPGFPTHCVERPATTVAAFAWFGCARTRKNGPVRCDSQIAT